MMVDNHYRILTNLKEMSKMLLNLAWCHRWPCPTHHRDQGILKLWLHLIHGGHTQNHLQLKMRRWWRWRWREAMA
jgi:hypothetical protein